jgi:hypothetical protein
MTTPEVNAQVHVLGLNALSTLALLQPPINEELEKKLLDATIKLYFEPPSDKKSSSKPEQAEALKAAQVCVATHDQLLYSTADL